MIAVAFLSIAWLAARRLPAFPSFGLAFALWSGVVLATHPARDNGHGWVAQAPAWAVTSVVVLAAICAGCGTRLTAQAVRRVFAATVA
ncbi:MAG: hypothetical protein AB7L13_19505 [Acidimicrobiia bacterium]